ncbi:hypothetical protein NDU88_007554 [Pleurodeles waltl]|uniref:Uncharacterized protein n=1 Tax=Pleurodeles waltl TaxID=8319 RepID=A0AAV7SSU9_PLEWA|nr:hypothetical protein NDU88_007554 [Pleurodeles waltl]
MKHLFIRCVLADAIHLSEKTYAWQQEHIKRQLSCQLESASGIHERDSSSQLHSHHEHSLMRETAGAERPSQGASPVFRGAELFEGQKAPETLKDGIDWLSVAMT